MFESMYRLLSFFDSIESIRGRKKLQKMIYLLKNTGAEFPFKYRYHHYGPYSAQLQEEVNDLVEKGFIEETNEDNTYSYQLTDEGRSFKKQIQQQIQHQNDDNLFEFQEIMTLLSQEDSQFLEVASTYAFLLESGDTPFQAKQKTAELKPLLVDHLDRAIQFYDNIKTL